MLCKYYLMYNKNSREFVSKRCRFLYCMAEPEIPLTFLSTQRFGMEKDMFIVLGGGLLIIIIAVIVAVVSSVVSAVAADQDIEE